MTIRFDGRVAVVTGGGNGLGRDDFLELAMRGARVVVNDLGSTGAGQGKSHLAADQVVAEIRATGGEAVANYDSVATRDSGNAIVETAMMTFGRVDILINNAGFLRNSRFEDLTDEQIDAMMDVHLKAAFYVAQPAYRAMKMQKYGRILFTSSAAGVFGNPWQANYGAAKAGLVGLMNAVALEGERHGILANALLPTAHTLLAAEIDEGWMEVTSVAKVLPEVDFSAISSHLGVEQNTPLAHHLVSQNCTSTQNCYSAIAGRYSRVILGSTDGWSNGLTELASPADVEAHWAEINDRARYHVPRCVFEEFVPAIACIKAARNSQQARQWMNPN
ncbi:SDR family NAD(P)-dependent oxidoreductase [Paraburkholderia sp. MM5384-R2]|uniref:SDR family NAD(P)-dependent oxidoreductase n=1 Tax=Paraburkholderia sp. MM5384-R2 TaxID=2723097 RepID=UPI001620CA01|nr:SDR family NAD(P)-dependent oxidoreductase [Paraburkholderia sp. MM5384-R2]MBB5498668.1 NAD(P)-dependent dehydrogenase (short-subunit alcohol dehydrogenase family) [Paraburkholderia sp. MM5384-R2]